MFHRWAALLLVLALWAMSPKTAGGQAPPTQPPGQKAGRFGKPYPNPMNPDVRIPFSVDTIGGCRDGVSRQSVVTVRISNILGKVMDAPILLGDNNSITQVPSALNGAPLSNMKLGCGDYVAYWTYYVGQNKNTGKEVASGTYLVQVFVNGVQTDAVKILVRK